MCIYDTPVLITDEGLRNVRDILQAAYQAADDFQAPLIRVYDGATGCRLPPDHPVVNYTLAAIVSAPILLQGLDAANAYIEKLLSQISAMQQDLIDCHRAMEDPAVNSSAQSKSLHSVK